MTQSTFALEINSYQDWRIMRWLRKDKKVFFHGRNIEVGEIVACGEAKIETNEQQKRVHTKDGGLEIDPRTNIVTYCRRDSSLVGTRIRAVRYELLTRFQRVRVEDELSHQEAYRLIRRFPKESALLLGVNPYLGTIWPDVDFLRIRYKRTEVREDQKAFVSILKEYAATAARFVTVQ